MKIKQTLARDFNKTYRNENFKLDDDDDHSQYNGESQHITEC